MGDWWLSSSSTSSHQHLMTQTHRHTLTRTKDTHTHTHTQRLYWPTHPQTHWHTHTHTLTHTERHTHKYIYTYKDPPPPHTHTDTNIPTHTHIYTDTHTDPPPNTHPVPDEVATASAASLDKSHGPTDCCPQPLLVHPLQIVPCRGDRCRWRCQRGGSGLRGGRAICCRSRRWFVARCWYLMLV